MEKSYVFNSLWNEACTQIHHFGRLGSNAFIFFISAMESVRYDFIEVLTNFGIPEIAEYILSYLDFTDLKNAERVCKLWRHIIRDGKIWKHCLQKMLRNPTLRKIYRRCHAISSKPHPMDIQIRDPIFCKLACHTLTRYHQQLLYNWMTGAQQEESVDIYVRGKTVSFDINSRYIVIGQLDGTVLVRMRESVTLESQSYDTQELNVEGLQSGIRCLQLNEENILVCGGARGVVQIWDVHVGKLLKRFTEQQGDPIEHVKFENELLITGSNVQHKETFQGRLTLWNIRYLSRTSMEGEILFPLQKIFGLALSDGYIVVLIGKEPNFEIQVRLKHDPLILLHSMSYRSHAFSGFHCHDRFVAAGSDDGKIRIWDVRTGTCKRVLLRPSHDTGPFWLRFNSSFLITNNSRGIGIWNFKEAVNAFLHPCTKLHFCSFQTGSFSQSNQWHFQMDAFEIIRFEHLPVCSVLCDLPGGYRGKSFIVRHQFLNH